MGGYSWRALPQIRTPGRKVLRNPLPSHHSLSPMSISNLGEPSKTGLSLATSLPVLVSTRIVCFTAHLSSDLNERTTALSHTSLSTLLGMFGCGHFSVGTGSHSLSFQLKVVKSFLTTDLMSYETMHALHSPHS